MGLLRGRSPGTFGLPQSDLRKCRGVEYEVDHIGHVGDISRRDIKGYMNTVYTGPTGYNYITDTMTSFEAA